MHFSGCCHKICEQNLPSGKATFREIPINLLKNSDL